MRLITPAFVAAFPQPYVDAPADDLVVIGRASPIRTPKVITMAAYGAPGLKAVVNASLQRTAYRAAIAWAHRNHYG